MGAREPRRAGSPVVSARAWTDPRSPAPGLALARRAGAALALVAIPVLAGAALAAGTPGLWGALVGLALVGALFGAAALLHAWAARLRPTTQVAVMAAGMGARLLAYLAVVETLRGMDALHRPSLVVATAVALVVTLAGELWLVSRTPAFFWVTPAPSDAQVKESR